MNIIIPLFTLNALQCVYTVYNWCIFFFKDSGLEADLQQLALAKTGGEGGDGPDVREEFASNTEPVEMPEAGMSSIQKVIYVVSVFQNIISLLI